MVCISGVYYPDYSAGSVAQVPDLAGASSVVDHIAVQCLVAVPPPVTAFCSCTATDSVGGRISGKNNGLLALLVLRGSVFNNVGSFAD